MVPALSLVALSLSFGTYAFTTEPLSIGPVADLPIVNKEIAPDGFSRAAVLAGGTFPGPLIIGDKGGRFDLHVINELDNPDMLRETSVHWHGFFQRGSSWADGADSVTQCPIPPGHSFHYQFDVPDQAGTFWYHSHSRTQYCDGLRGAMVVYDPKDPHKGLYDIDDKYTVITLADWYHTLSPNMSGKPTPDSTLINGQGRAPNSSTKADLAVINVKQGSRYRFRLVSISCDPFYDFSIDNHTMTVIEADGINTEPLVVDLIQIYAGQRYSFVLHADQDVTNYWIRAKPNNARDPSFNGGLNSAILRYDGASPEDPTTKERPSAHRLREDYLHPLEKMPVPGKHSLKGADHTEILNLSFQNVTDPDTKEVAGKFMINGHIFETPSLPVLLQILNGVHDAHDLLPHGSVYNLERGKVVDLVIPPLKIGGPHPFHLHGHNFWVIQSADSDLPNFENPIVRDVVNIGMPNEKNVNVTIRFVTDNPGPWFLHCHIDWHLDAGLAIVFAEGVNETGAIKPPPAAWGDLCPAFNASSKDPNAHPNDNLVP
uniref:laccase n=1 Tax=Cerrena sp. HYB07 TaxID=1329779 RepID=A0A0A0Q7X1_9APHY|nr:laccase 6 precursor [Cerrena sp. HYB07]